MSSLFVNEILVIMLSKLLSNKSNPNAAKQFKSARRWRTDNLLLYGIFIFLLCQGAFNAIAQTNTIYQEDFENYNDSLQQQAYAGQWNTWRVINITCADSSHGRSLHLTMNSQNGNCKYHRNHKSEVLTYKQVNATHYDSLQLSFKWLCNGDSGNDRAAVKYSLDGQNWQRLSTGGINGNGWYVGSTSFQTQTLNLPSSLHDTTFYVGFYWENISHNGGNQTNNDNYPAMIVDDISIEGSPLFPPLSVSGTMNDVRCNGGTDGSVDVTVSGGLTPYSFNWSNSATTEDIIGLGAGTYSVTVSDNSGSIVTDSFHVGQPGTLSLATSSSNVTCKGGSDGSASVSVSGGTSPYSYSWSNSDTTSSIDNLSAGSYSVTVTDQNNCQSIDSVSISQGGGSGFVWNGSESSDWHNGSNWNCNTVPTSSDSVFIPLNVPNMPVVSGNAESSYLSIDSGAIVSFYSSSDTPILDVHGDLVGNGSIDYSAGKVRLKGSSPQKITGLTTITLHNLVIDNSAPSFPQIILETNVEVANELSLVDGNIQTGNDTISLTNTSASGLTNYGEQSHIVGYFKRHITSNRSEYVFPLGEGTPSTYYQGAIVNRNMSNVNYIVSKFVPELKRYDSTKLNADAGEFEYNYLCNEGMWIFEPDQQPGLLGMYDVKLWVENLSGLTDNLFGIVKRPLGADPTAWSMKSCVLNSPGGDGRLLSDGYARASFCQSFSEQGVGSGDGTTQPINLISFDAELNNGQVDLNWTTATEVNNDYFTVQRSTNGHEWEDLKTVDGAGNSSTRIDYEAVDQEPHEGISYYRLKQTDFNGEYSHTGIVTINNKGFTEAEITVYPNPTRGKVNIEMRSNASSIQMALYNVSGNLLFEKQLGSSNGRYQGSFNFEEKLSTGIYFLRMTPRNGEKSYVEKIRITR